VPSGWLALQQCLDAQERNVYIGLAGGKEDMATVAQLQVAKDALVRARHPAQDDDDRR
jgi:hypothetical protein